MQKKQKKVSFRQKIHHHLHKHIHKAIHVAAFAHQQLFHSLELVTISLITIFSWSILFANLSWLNESFYRSSDSEVAQELLYAMQNPTTSLKLGNIISVWSMDSSVENTFAKWYCTYGAARISPEFFPFIDEKVQQRTWWGNAVDRCKNAYDTWYSIWSTPKQGALVVYNAGGRFWSYGHVGKVLHYAANINKIIVRDMARVARSTMSDRWEDLSTANVKCYIYNNKTNQPTPPVVETPIIEDQNNSSQQTNSDWGTTTDNSSHGSSPSWSTSLPVPPTQPTPPVVETPTVPVIPTVPQPTAIHKELPLVLDNLSDIAQHFLTQNTIAIVVDTKSPLAINGKATIRIKITNKKTWENYSGLLPFTLSFLSTNDNIQTNIANIKLINNDLMDIGIVAKKLWTATIIITIDEVKIAETSFSIT